MVLYAAKYCVPFILRCAFLVTFQPITLPAHSLPAYSYVVKTLPDTMPWCVFFGCTVVVLFLSLFSDV